MCHEHLSAKRGARGEQRQAFVTSPSHPLRSALVSRGSHRSQINKRLLCRLTIEVIEDMTHFHSTVVHTDHANDTHGFAFSLL